MPAISGLLDELTKRGGSDLHLSATQPPLARVRAELVPLRNTPPTAKELEEMLFELITPTQRARLVADAALEFSLANDSARFRATYYMKQGGLAAVFRLLPVRTIAEIGAPEVVAKLAERTSGLVLVAGPADSGKTTTATALVSSIRESRSCRVLVLENPIEHLLETKRAHVTQREIGAHAPSMAVALASASRGGADVVATSDLSTGEELENALALASSGALVIATCRARGAVDALSRFVSVFPADARPRVRARLADALVAVVAQHLVRGSDAAVRVAAFEVLIATPAVRGNLREGPLDALESVLEAGKDAGMVSLRESLERLLADGKIPPQPALARALEARRLPTS